MEISEKALKEIIAKVVEETIKQKQGEDFNKEMDESGIFKIETSTVKCEPFGSLAKGRGFCL